MINIIKMGNFCICLDYQINQQKEFQIGSGIYSFKRLVCNKKKITLYYFAIIIFLVLQIFPETENQKKYYGKDCSCYKEIKNKINRNDSLVHQGVVNYMNGTVQVIIPYQDSNS